jgi:hypothetical protein
VLRSVKSISTELLALLASTHGYADLAWTRSIPIPGDDDFPCLELPEAKLAYATTRGYPIKFAVRKLPHGSGALLVVQLESFEVATHDAAGWAIPTKYKPETDEERIAHELGFDEGWEDAQRECIFLCDSRFDVFWRAAVLRRRFGLTATGSLSLYPVTLGKRELGPLADALKAWAR